MLQSSRINRLEGEIAESCLTLAPVPRHSRPIVDQMYAAISKAVREPDVTAKFVDQFDMEVTLPAPDAFAAYVAKEQEFWGKVIRENNLRAG